MMKAAALAHPVTDGIHSVRPCGSCGARAYGVCSGVGPPDLPRLAALATIVEIARGQTFVHEGAPAEHFCILICGSARLYKLLPDGRRQIIGFGYPRSFLGLANSAGYASSAEALEPVRICRLPRPKLQAVLRDSDAMEQRLLDVAVNDLVLAHEQMLLLGRKTATERIASFLLFQTTRPQPRRVRWPRIHLPMSRGDIADYLGLNAQTVSRTLAELNRRGVIAVPNIHEIVILDLPRLKALSQESMLERIPDAGESVQRTRRAEQNLLLHSNDHFGASDLEMRHEGI